MNLLLGIAGTSLVVLCFVMSASQAVLLLLVRLERHRTSSGERSERISAIIALDGIEASPDGPVPVVRATMAAGGDELEVVVVVDGSANDVLDTLRSEFDLEAIHPNFERLLETGDVRTIYRSSQDRRLIVAEKLSGGVGDALNAGLCLASGTRACAVEPGVLLNPGALEAMDQDWGESQVACSGHLLPANQTTSMGPRCTREWVMTHQPWSRAGGSVTRSHSVDLIDRAALLRVGGYVTPEDPTGSELLVRLSSQGVLLRTAGDVGYLPASVGSSTMDPPARPVRLSALRPAYTGSRWRRFSALHTAAVAHVGRLLLMAALIGLLTLALGNGGGTLALAGAAWCFRATVFVAAHMVADHQIGVERTAGDRILDVFSSTMAATRFA